MRYTALGACMVCVQGDQPFIGQVLADNGMVERLLPRESIWVDSILENNASRCWPCPAVGEQVLCDTMDGMHRRLKTEAVRGAEFRCVTESKCFRSSSGWLRDGKGAFARDVLW